MKLPQMILLFGGLSLVGCAHTSSSQQGRATSPPATLTPANGMGSPRPVTGASFVSAQGVAPAAAPSAPDQASGDEDWQSIQEIRQALAADPRLAATASQITINARDGRVLLRGQVTTAEQRALIEKAARQAGGVIDVRNMLQVME